MIDAHFDFDLNDVVWVIFGNTVTEATVSEITIRPGGYDIRVRSIEDHIPILCHHASDIYRTHDDAMYSLLKCKKDDLTEIRNGLIDQVNEIDAELKTVRDKLWSIDRDKYNTD